MQIQWADIVESEPVHKSGGTLVGVAWPVNNTRVPVTKAHYPPTAATGLRSARHLPPVGSRDFSMSRHDNSFYKVNTSKKQYDYL